MEIMVESELQEVDFLPPHLDSFISMIPTVHVETQL